MVAGRNEISADLPAGARRRTADRDLAPAGRRAPQTRRRGLW